MNKAGLSVSALAAALLLAAVSATPGAATASPSERGPAGLPQGKPSEADLDRWEGQLTLPPHVATRLDWARGSFVPSGYRKLESLARAKASAIAAGRDFAALAKETAADRVFSAAGISGLDASEAAFLVLAMAAKDMDDDLRMIMAEIKAANAAKKKLRDLIEELNDWISEAMAKASDHSKSSDIDNSKVSEKPPATAGRTQPAKVAPFRSVSLQKAFSPVIHFEYVMAPTIRPLPPRGPDVSVSTLKSLLAENKDRLDGLNELSEMTAIRLQATMDRRSKFVETLSQMMKKTSTTQDILVQNIK